MEVMNRASIILLLSCGAILVSAGHASRPVLGRYLGTASRRSQNYNSNVNTNIVSGPAPRPSEEESNPTIDEISRNLYAETDPKTASLATSAAEATMSILKALTAEFTDTAAASVAQAVSRILTERSDRIYARRNYNVNTNANTNVIGGDGSENRGSSLDGSSPADLLDLENGLGTDSDQQGLVYGPMNFGVPHGIENDLTTGVIEVTREPDVDDEEDDKVTSLERLVEADEEEIEAEALASKSLGRRRWPRVNRRNLNSNANKNRMNRRRNSMNSNSNSNSNNFRRNINNRMSRRFRSRRD